MRYFLHSYFILAPKFSFSEDGKQMKKRRNEEEQTNDNNVVICHRIQYDAIVLQKSSLIATSATKQSQTQSAYS